MRASQLVVGNTYHIEYTEGPGESAAWLNYSGPGVYTGQSMDIEGPVLGFAIPPDSDVCWFPIKCIHPMKCCKRCGSYAINPSNHGREPKTDLDLCDVCYWRKRAEPQEPLPEKVAEPPEKPIVLRKGLASLDQEFLKRCAATGQMLRRKRKT